MNKDLYNSEKGRVEFPKDKRRHMKICFHKVKNADENTEGFNRNQELQNQSFIEYKQLKRIKNFLFFSSQKLIQSDAALFLITFCRFAFVCHAEMLIQGTPFIGT